MATRSGIARKVKPRNPYVLPSRRRKAGAMKDKRKGRGGAANFLRELPEWLAEYYLDEAERAS